MGASRNGRCPTRSRGGELVGKAQLAEDLSAGRSWTAMTAEDTGITNLAEVITDENGGDTVFVKYSLEGKRGEYRQLHFGYSDKARVYLNGTLIYSGDNTYMTRDYRYLGTIGLFDSVVLPLKKGENELLIAVSEAFGGWGIMGQISTLE